jgi:hypothetical protein
VRTGWLALDNHRTLPSPPGAITPLVIPRFQLGLHLGRKIGSVFSLSTLVSPWFVLKTLLEEQFGDQTPRSVTSVAGSTESENLTVKGSAEKTVFICLYATYRKFASAMRRGVDVMHSCGGAFRYAWKRRKTYCRCMRHSCKKIRQIRICESKLKPQLNSISHSSKVADTSRPAHPTRRSKCVK